MHAQPDTGRRARLRLAAAAVCSLLAAAGGVLATAPAHAAESASICVATTNDRPDGWVLSGGGAGTGLLGCPSGSATRHATTTPPSVPGDGGAIAGSPTGAPVDLGAPGTGDPTPAEPTDGASLSTSSASTTTPAPEHLTIHRSSPAVYPAKDGYLDVVRFSVREADADGGCVPLVGHAVLWHAGRSVKTWTMHGLSSVIAWNGRVGSRIVPGLYTLRVTVQAPDGTERSDDTTVRVMPQHLSKRTLTIRTDVGARSVSAELPKRLVSAYRLGHVWVATRTVATVHGSAKLIFSGDGGQRKVVRLRSGVHTTPAVMLPPGFERTTITHAWKKGAAHLKSLQAIWTYSVLE